MFCYCMIIHEKWDTRDQFASDGVRLDSVNGHQNQPFWINTKSALVTVPRQFCTVRESHNMWGWMSLACHNSLNGGHGPFQKFQKTLYHLSKWVDLNLASVASAGLYLYLAFPRQGYGTVCHQPLSKYMNIITLCTAVYTYKMLRKHSNKSHSQTSNQHRALLYVPTSRSCVTQLPHSYLHHVQLVYPIVRPRYVEFAVCKVRHFHLHAIKNAESRESLCRARC